MKLTLLILCVFVRQIISGDVDDSNILMSRLDDAVPLETNKNTHEFSALKMEKINNYFQNFKNELNNFDLKKFYSLLFNLNIDCENLIRSSTVLSNKQINEFIDLALISVHKKMNLKGNIDEFLAKYKKNEAEFVLHQNVIDEDLIKSNDWKFKSEIVENEFHGENLDNVEFAAQKLRKNIERVKKAQQVINSMDGVNDEINLGHSVLFFDHNLDD